ncbi:MAG: hypothetical protein HQL10_13445 [Nitrospirae bacterium]|nr:hypothetical protein [Nitrospirota bacterium]
MASILEVKVFSGKSLEEAAEKAHGLPFGGYLFVGSHVMQEKDEVKLVILFVNHSAP